jgi:hypothetical protein
MFPRLSLDRDRGRRSRLGDDLRPPVPHGVALVTNRPEVLDIWGILDEG